MTDFDAARERSRETWEAMAPGWSERREDLWSVSHPVSEWLVDRLDPKDGETILDLAAGLGETGFLAAQRIGDSGSVLITDFAPSMLAAALRSWELRTPTFSRWTLSRRLLRRSVWTGFAAGRDTCSWPIQQPPSPRRIEFCGLVAGWPFQSSMRPNTIPGYPQ